MAKGLYPIFTMPAAAQPSAASDAGPTKFGLSWSWDFLKGDFVVDGNGRLPRNDGNEAWWQWCVKAVSIENSVYLIYNSQYGLKSEDLIGRNGRDFIEAMVKERLTETLKYDRRTARVSDFEFEWLGSTLNVMLMVTSDQGESTVLRMVFGEPVSTYS